MMGMPRMKKATLIAMASVAILLIAVACGEDGSDKVVTGRVVDATARDFSEIELIIIRDPANQVWEFGTDGPIGISIGHLRQHQVLGEKVQVTYHKMDGKLIATDVRDAEAPGGVTP